ncbi:MAG: hypothetical protein KGS72_10385 [Cyanobacteria bacterium REEB67]|nr:hypothetical protein [Cyanobacteria bacterium REEB67]
MSERSEHMPTAGHDHEFSISKFFHDAYDKGLVKAVEDSPKEAAFTAVGAVAGVAAAVYLTKGAALEGVVIPPRNALFRKAEGPANIFSLLSKSEKELSSIAARNAGSAEPLFKAADTTMTLRNPQKWQFLLEAGGHDRYNAEVLRQANRWGTLAETKWAQGKPLSESAFEGLSIPQPGDLPVSFGSVKQALLTHWKYANRFEPIH